MKFNQQQVSTGNMSLSGGNGRIWITPASEGCDVALSGKSLEHQLSPLLRELFGRKCDGYKQMNRKIGKENAPFWRTGNWSQVEQVAKLYSQTTR